MMVVDMAEVLEEKIDEKSSLEEIVGLRGASFFGI